MNKNKIILLITLLILLIGVTNATEVLDDRNNSINENTIVDEVQSVYSTSDTINDNNMKEQDENKEINKDKKNIEGKSKQTTDIYNESKKKLKEYSKYDPHIKSYTEQPTKYALLTIDAPSSVDSSSGFLVSVSGTDEAGAYVLSGNVDFEFNGEHRISRISMTSKASAFFYAPSTSGYYTITVRFNNNPSPYVNWLPTYITKTIKVVNQNYNDTNDDESKKSTLLTLETNEVRYYADGLNISGKLTDESGKELSTLPVEIKIVKEAITSKEIKNYTVYTKNGKYSLNDEIYIHDNGNYTITVYYNGNKQYSPSSNETTLKIKIEDRPTTLSLNTKENIYLNEDMNITGRLIDRNGYGIEYATINISIGDYKFSTTTNMTGNYNLTIKSQNITLIRNRNIELYKNSNIKIITNYTGKWHYASSSNITHVTFYNYTAQDIKDAIISIQSPNNIDTGKTTTINLTITDKNTKKVINGTALIKINGLSIKDINTNTSTIPIKNGKGTLTLSLANYSGKEYTLTAIFAKTGYNRAEKTTKMTVNKGTYKTFTIKLNGTSEQKIRIRQTLTDTNGNKIYGNTQVAIKLGDRTVKTLTVSNSLLDTEITVPYLPSGENKFKITLGENYRYKTKIINSTINITKQDIIVNITPIKAKSGNTVTLKATLTNKNTKTPVISGKYIFRVNGKTVPYITKSYEEIYTTKNVTKGVAQWEYTIPNDMNPGKYIITLNYNGNTQSNPIKYTEKLLTII